MMDDIAANSRVVDSTGLTGVKEGCEKSKAHYLKNIDTWIEQLDVKK